MTPICLQIAAPQSAYNPELAVVPQEAAAADCNRRTAVAADHPQCAQQSDAFRRDDAASTLGEHAVTQNELFNPARGSRHAGHLNEVPQRHHVCTTGTFNKSAQAGTCLPC